MQRRIALLGTSAFLFLLFIAFSYLVQKNFFLQFDFDTTVRLQDNISRRFDNLFSWFSIVGSFQILIVVLISILFLYRKFLFGLVAFFLFGMFHIIELYGKNNVEQQPPPHFLLRTEHPIDFPQFHVSTEFAYPSGHSGRTIFISVLLLFFILTNRRIPTIHKSIVVASVLLFDTIMLVSRVYLGEHWITDVIGGTLLALAFSVLSLAFLPQRKKYKKASAEE